MEIECDQETGGVWGVIFREYFSGFQIFSGSDRTVGEPTEDVPFKEGPIRYDIRFNVIVPESGQVTEVIISIEMVSVEEWKNGAGTYQRSLKFIRKELPAVTGERHAQNLSEQFAQLVEYCTA